MNDARAGEMGPVLYLAQRQTAGRGRGGAWWSGDGGLTFSILTGEIPIAGDQIPRLSLGVGVAVCEAIEPLAGQPIELKWPNDIMARGRKLAGMLIEIPAGRPPRLVIGIGINVANSLDQAPEEVRRSAITLTELTAAPNRVEVLISVINALQGVLNDLANGNPKLADRWRQRSFLDGRQVEIELPGGERMTGIVQSIDDQGALLVATGQGVQRCVSGSVVDWQNGAKER